MSLSEDGSPKIAIVGAGLAGLTAAYRFQKSGYNVQVFEARQRPGGRVLTAQLGLSYEELGGKNFLDAGQARNSLKLIQELGLEILENVRPYFRAFIIDNKIISYHAFLRRVKNPRALKNKLAKASVLSQNLQEVIHSVFEDSELRLLFTVIMGSYEGSHPKNLDPSTFDTLYQFFMNGMRAMKMADKGQILMVKWVTLKGGNAQLPLALSERLNGRIHYNHVLEALNNVNEKVILHFKNQKKIAFDLVLLAIPCSTFEAIDFGTDTIPPTQLARIQEIQYGINGKILFPTSIENPPFDFVVSPDVIGWLNQDHKIMTFYYGGQHDAFTVQNAHMHFNQGMELMRNVYPALALNTNFIEEAKDQQLVCYKNAIFKSWSDDPYSKGSYSNRAPGTAAWLSEIENSHGEEVRKAFQPIKGKIFFAGEHTTILDALGTMEGAVESGECMARLIDNVIKTRYI